MALKPCVECGHLLSTDAKICTQCGKKSPHKRPLNRKWLLYGCGAYLALGTIGIIITAITKGIEEASAPGAESPEHAQREDSTTAVTLLAQPHLTDSLAMAADSLIHLRSLSLAHDAVHTQAVTGLIARAKKALVPRERGIGLVDEARASLAAVHAPISKSDSVQIARLKRDITRQDALIKREAERFAAEFMVEQRKRIAHELELTYLDRGLDVTVSTRGPRHTILRMKWILTSRLAAHEMSKNTALFKTLRDAEFTRFEMTDGYGETWSWDLK